MYCTYCSIEIMLMETEERNTFMLVNMKVLDKEKFRKPREDEFLYINGEHEQHRPTCVGTPQLRWA